jgi:hypothetical protein
MDVSNRAASFHDRVIGFVFLVSGGFMIVGALLVTLALFGAIGMTARLGQFVLAAAALGFGLSVYLAFAFSAAHRDGTYVSLAVLAAIVFLAMLLFFIIQARYPWTLTVGVAIGALFAVFPLYQFWFAQQYVPTHFASLVNVQATLVPVSDASPRVAKATIVATNPGTQRMNILAGEYVVTVQRLLRSTRVTAGSDNAYSKPFLDLNDPPRHSYLRLRRFSRPKVIGFGRLFGESNFLSPSEGVSREFLSDAPGVGALRMRLVATVIVVNANQLQPALKPQPTPEVVEAANGAHVVVLDYQLRQPAILESWINGSDLRILVNYYLDTRPRPLAAVYLIREDRIPSDGVVLPEDASRYGAEIASTWASDEAVFSATPEKSRS